MHQVWPPLRTRATARKSVPIPNVTVKIIPRTSPSIENSVQTTPVPTAGGTTTTKTPTNNCKIKGKAPTKMITRTPTRMKTPAVRTEEVGIESAKMVLARGEATLAEKTENVGSETPGTGESVRMEEVGIESGTTVLAPEEVALAEKTENEGPETPGTGENVSNSGERATVKKKVRIVKKIVKKKVIKKVPKRVSLSSNCNEPEKVEAMNDVSTPNPSSFPCVSGEVENSNPPRIESSVSMEIENLNADVDDLRKVENLEGFEVNETENGVCLVKNVSTALEVCVGVNTLVDECETVGLAETGLLEDQNCIECLKGKHDNENADVEEHKGNEVAKEQGEKSESSGLKMDVGNEGKEDVQELSEKSECTDLKIDVELDNGIKGEEVLKEQVKKSESFDLKMDVELHEGVEGEKGVKDQVEKTECLDLKLDARLSDAVDVEEGVKELEETSEVSGLRVGQGLGDRILLNGETEVLEGQSRPRTEIFISGLDKETKEDDIRKVFEEVGSVIEVRLVMDGKTGKNRGFGFIRYSSAADAKRALTKYHDVEDVFGKHLKIKVAWAEKSVEPGEEEMQKMKSVYAEHIPSSWDEEKVNDYFKIFGEIESIALAKNLRSTKRNDFAFINYISRESALACIEALTRKPPTLGGSKVHMKVCLAKSIQKGKRIIPISKSVTTKKVSKVNQNANQAVFEPQLTRGMGVSSISRHEDARTDRSSSTNAELVQLLREQASWKQATPAASSCQLEYLQPLPGRKRSFADLADQDPRAYNQAHLERRNAAHTRLPPPTSTSRSICSGVATTSFPRYNQQRVNYTSRSFNGVEANPRHFQRREQFPYHGSSSVYRHMQ